MLASTKDEALKELQVWLELIGEITTPRPFWGSTFQVEQADLDTWIRRIHECKITITGRRINIPKRSECPDLYRNLSYFGLDAGTAKDDRKLIHLAIASEDGLDNIEMRRDCQLQHLYSKIHDAVIFTSNVDSSRFRRIARECDASTLGFARIDETDHVIIHFIEVKGDILEIEKAEALEKEEYMWTTIGNIMLRD